MLCCVKPTSTTPLLPPPQPSLIERGKLEQGEKVLQRIRGTKGELSSGAYGCQQTWSLCVYRWQHTGSCQLCYYVTQIAHGVSECTRVHCVGVVRATS